MVDWFVQLVQVSVGTRGRLDAAPSAAEWDALLETAKQQSVAGFLCRCLDVLPEEQMPSRDQCRRWMMDRTRAVRRNALVDDCASQVTALFAEGGFKSAVLKGQGVARLYPDPTLRQSGDIDLWVPGGREKVLDFLKGRYPLRKPVYHHVEAKFFEDVGVEVHFLPAFLYNPLRNRKLQRFFEAEAGKWDMAGDAQTGFRYPKPLFDAVFSLVHLSKHILNEGVGLRQLMDHHFILAALPAFDRPALRSLVSDLGLGSLARALSWVDCHVFGTVDPDPVFAPDRRRGERLMQDMLLSGNFGYYDKRPGGKIARAFRFLADYPSEVLWSPFWKAWHRIWRKGKGYL